MNREDRRLQLKQLRSEAQAIEQNAMRESAQAVARKIKHRAEMLLEDLEQ